MDSSSRGDADSQFSESITGKKPANFQKKLIISMLLNFGIFVVEFLGGIFTNSLALISDSLHNLSDFLALLLSYFASLIVLRKSNSQKSFGYVRVEIFVAFVNAKALVLIGLYLIYEAIRRFSSPEPIAGGWMLLIAIFGFGANVIATLLLRAHRHHDLNIKSAYLHLLTDAMESLAVVVTAILITWWDWKILDPILSIAIGIFIIRSGWEIVSETVNILTEGTPRGINLDEVATFIQSFPGVVNIHHLHIWGISSRVRALSAHIVVQDQLISKGNEITTKLEKELERRFGINHPTLQLETCICHEQGVVVDINIKGNMI